MFRTIAVTFLCWLTACAAVRAERIDVAGKSYETTLDSDVARRYATEGAFNADIVALEKRFASRLPSRDELAQIARDFSPDFATLFYVRAVLRDDRSARMQQQLAALVHDDRAPSSSLSVIFVPGWFYKAHGEETGADFHRQIALFKKSGIEARLLEIGENASIEDNAAFIASTLRELPRDRRYAVVSASKAGPEVALALGSLNDADSAHIAAWVNVGGAVGGSPLADDAGAGVKCSVVKGVLFVKGYTMDGLLSMKTGPRRTTLEALHIPRHIFILNYVPAPMAADVSARGRDGYDAMKAMGPNDGLVLLADAIVPGGATVFEPGLDHFLKTNDIDKRTAALIAIVDEATRR